MAYGFLDIASTQSVQAAQAANGSAEYWSGFQGSRAFGRLTDAEVAFIRSRDSFYMATVSENSWPYVQHRGGPPGFLHILDDRTMAFADYRGNRQYISVGNLAANDRAALIFMDYPGRRRLKVYGHVEACSLVEHPELAERLAIPGYRAKAERALLVHLKAFDWNCPQHITPRFSEPELADALAPVRQRVVELEAENKRLRQQLAGGTVGPAT